MMEENVNFFTLIRVIINFNNNYNSPQGDNENREKKLL